MLIRPNSYTEHEKKDLDDIFEVYCGNYEDYEKGKKNIKYIKYIEYLVRKILLLNQFFLLLTFSQANLLKKSMKCKNRF